MAPQNVFDHCAQTLWRRKLKFGDFNINLWSIKKVIFWFPWLSSVTIATSLPESTRYFLKLSFHMFPYNEILKSFQNENLTGYLKQTPQSTSKYQISAN